MTINTYTLAQNSNAFVYEMTQYDKHARLADTHMYIYANYEFFLRYRF